MLVNGERCAHISTEDRGLLYGDGVFETILCEKGKPVLFAEHMQRLQSGCLKLGISNPDANLILAELTDGETVDILKRKCVASGSVQVLAAETAQSLPGKMPSQPGQTRALVRKQQKSAPTPIGNRRSED